MQQVKIVHPSDLSWEAHPQVTGVEVAYLLSERDENMPLTVMLVRPPTGSRVDEHTHGFDEIIYVVKGKAMIHIDTIGEVQMMPGTFLRIPGGVAHRPYAIEEDFMAYDIFVTLPPP